MAISSLVVETNPEHTASVAESLEALESVEVHEIHQNKVVVTIETATVDASHEIASSFIKYPGVLNVNLVYANFEDLSSAHA